MTLTAARKCIFCGFRSPIEESELIWPLDLKCPSCGKLPSSSNGIAMFAPDLANTMTGMNPSHFDKLEEIESTHFWFVARNDLIVGLANKYFPEAASFLEIGCGNGAVIRALRKSRKWRRLVGSELHPSGLHHARARMPADVEFVQMDARNIPVEAAFDLTGAFDVIEHVPEDEDVLRALRKATKPGGGIIIAVPQHRWLWSLSDVISFHQRRYIRGELEAKAQRAGFEVVFSTSYTTLLLPLMMISRWTDRRKPEQFSMEREFEINPVVNYALTKILQFEVFLTRLGVSWPAGGSRILVGRAI